MGRVRASGSGEPTSGIVGAHALSGVMPGKDLIQLRDLRPDVLRRLLSRARQHAWALDEDPFDVGQTLRGQVIGLLFFEDSTRTRLSFAMAVHRLGGRIIELTDRGSSLSKGETLADTARTVEAMGVSRLVVRAKQTEDVLEVALRGAGLVSQSSKRATGSVPPVGSRPSPTRRDGGLSGLAGSAAAAAALSSARSAS